MAKKAIVKKIVENNTIKNMMDEPIITIEESIVADVIFPTTEDIGTGKDGTNGIVITEDIQRDIQEDNIIMIDKETSCFHSVKIPKIDQRVSLSDSIIDVPCYKCLVFIMCKQKIDDSVVQFAQVFGCPDAQCFISEADQDSINHMREIFGLEPYP